MTPQENLAALAANPYPGRGICVGLDETGKAALQVYWIMGRSANSRNRVFVADGTTLRTAPADASKVQNPSLIIYNAMREVSKVCIVSNGDQTDTIYDSLAAGGTFVDALDTRTYEPDAPNSTARISAVCDFRSGALVTEMSVIKKSLFAAAERQFFQYEALPKGAGYTITTYSGDGNPLPLAGPPAKAAEAIWNALDKANRVSLAVKSIDVGTGKSKLSIINAYKAV
jgi:phosphoribosylglycinamide formyltransferase-1